MLSPQSKSHGRKPTKIHAPPSKENNLAEGGFESLLMIFSARHYQNFENKQFYLSLLISFLVHLNVVILLLYSSVHHFRKPLKDVEIMYLNLKAKKKPSSVSSKSFQTIQGRKFMPKSDILTPKEQGSSELIKDIIRSSDKIRLTQKIPGRMNLPDVKRTISVPVLKSEKITNPKYLSYTEKIRQKIKQHAYSYVDHPDFQSGEVYLTFVLLSNGMLKQVKIIEEKTKAKNFLRTVGLRSIKESNPFPAFPKDLDYPELSFNIVISFEIKN